MRRARAGRYGDDEPIVLPPAPARPVVREASFRLGSTAVVLDGWVGGCAPAPLGSAVVIVVSDRVEVACLLYRAAFCLGM